MTTNPPTIDSWSYSRLADYAECPRKAFLKYAMKIKDPRPSFAADRGTRIHTVCEEFINGKSDYSPLTPFPDEVETFKDELISMRLQFKQGTVELEGEWGFNRDWVPVPYKGAWGRGKADLVLLPTPEEAVIVDFKTGKKFGNEIKHGQQLTAYAVATFCRYPTVKNITAELWYLDADDLTSIKMERERTLKVHLHQLDRRARQMTEATEFPATPNIIACKYCPYGDTGDCDKRVVDSVATTAFYKRKFGGKS